MARTDKTQIGILIKFFDKKYEESLKKGEIFFSELSLYRSNSDALTSAQADDQEAIHITQLDNKYEEIYFKNPKNGKLVKVDFEGGSVKLELPEADVSNMFISSFVFLNYDTDFDEHDGELSIKESVIEGLSDIANNRPYAVFYVDELIENVKKQFANREYSVYCNLVEYKSQRDFIKTDMSVQPIRLAFTKQEKYASQKEFRILIYNPNGLRPEKLIVPSVELINGAKIFAFESLKQLTATIK